MPHSLDKKMKKKMRKTVNEIIKNEKKDYKTKGVISSGRDDLSVKK